MAKTQLQKIKAQIDTYNEVSRNWALSQFISRLGALVLLLNKNGYNLTGKYRDGDYVYYNNKPKLAYPYKEKPIKETKFIQQTRKLL